jgi:hypothetical protein
MEAEAALRPFVQAASGGDAEVVSGGGRAAATTALLATGRAAGRPVDPVIWGDEKRMKRELVAWAKAVAASSMSAAGKNTSCSCSPSSPPLPPMRRRRV